MTPVPGMMLLGDAYTGRLASSGRVNCCVGRKLRSKLLAWFRFTEYVMSQLALRRLLRIGPAQLMFERTLRGDWKSEANRLTLGTLLANTVPSEPSAHCDGTELGSAA